MNYAGSAGGSLHPRMLLVLHRVFLPRISYTAAIVFEQSEIVNAFSFSSFLWICSRRGMCVCPKSDSERHRHQSWRTGAASRCCVPNLQLTHGLLGQSQSTQRDRSWSHSNPAARSLKILKLRVAGGIERTVSVSGISPSEQ